MKVIERRIGLLFAAFLLCFMVVAGRAFWLQGVQGATLASEAIRQQTQSVPLPSLRGSLLDRHGNPLASSEDAATIFAMTAEVEKPARTAEKLAPILELPTSKVLSEISAETSYVALAHKVDLPTAARIERLGLPGIGEDPDSRRTYPQGELASQVIGAVGAEDEGLSGLESGEESVLHGTDGERRIVTDVKGEPIRLETAHEAEDGSDVKLTLDPAIEAKTEQVLAEVGETYAPKGATAIVMDPRSSQILAMANWPPVDPTDLAAAGPEDLMNRATGFTYEPGSTFKAFTVSAALEEGLVTPETSFYLPSQLHVADRVIEDAEERPPIDLTVARILAQSSNVGAVEIGLKVGATRFSRWIDRFGFGRPTGVQFPGEEQGIVPALSEYSGSTMGNLPMGQGLSVTPMQMMAGYEAIADGGILRRPQLIEKVGDEPVQEPKGRRVIDAGVAAQVREMLEGVLAPGGTASEVSVPGYSLAGKTGTAQVAENGTYSKTKYVASFIGFAPARDPKLLVGVVVDQPQGEIYGGSVAAPAFGKIAAYALPYLGVAPDSLPRLCGVRLGALVAGAVEARIVGDPAVEVGSLAYDSRKVRTGTLFFCVPGEKSDGHDFAGSAVEAGAVGLVVERELDLDVAQVVVADARAAMAPLAARFWGDPTAELRVVGVTGTNGKTTTAFLIREVLEVAGIQCGLMGTVRQVVGGAEEEAERTTPEAIDLQETFRRMLEAGDRACAIEVSSHALALHRVDAVHFEAALFTNLTQDHLDFHDTMEEYFRSKRLLFEMGPKASIVNADDPYGRRLAEEFECTTFSAEGAKADFAASDVTFDPTSAQFTVALTPTGLKYAYMAENRPVGGGVAVRTRLPGEFNVANALGAFAAAVELGIAPEVAAEGLGQAERVPGRFEPVDEGQAFTVLVDYAHTPDSLENVLRAARRLTEGRVISVFGAGGDRDRDKRPKMGRAGAAGSDLAIVTSDNPRSEQPGEIIDEVVSGIENSASFEVEQDRRGAIARALREAAAGDTVVIAGKGHEQGQEFENGRKVPFDDREVAREELRKLVGAG